MIMSRKQEYVGRVKYANNLPPPIVAPKLINYTRVSNEQPDSANLITSLYTKTNVKNLINLNNDLAMPLNLLNLPNFLNKNDTSLIYGFDNIKLVDSDRKLLRDPRIEKKLKTDLNKITFLRRTEYLSTTIAKNKSNINNNNKNNDNNFPNSKKIKLTDDDNSNYRNDMESLSTPNGIVNKIESTFDNNNKTNITNDNLENLKHPVKKNLTAVKTWNLLPDTVSMDQNYFILKLIGSASLDNSDRDKLALDSTIFRPVELQEDEWISMYNIDKTDSKLFNENMEKLINDYDDKTNEENAVVEDNTKLFKFKRLKDFDMKQVPITNNHNSNSGDINSNTDSCNEVIIKFDNENHTAYYKPLRSKIELRRRRVNDMLKSLVRENNIDQLNITLRNPTTMESNLRDRLRMKYDPINFVPVDEEYDKKNEITESQVEDKQEDDTEDKEEKSIESNEDAGESDEK